VWLVGVQLGMAYSDEGRLLGEWVWQYGMGGLPGGTLLVGDQLYGYGAQLLEQLEGAGWLPVMRVEDGLRQRVRSGSRLRAWQRAQRNAEVLGGRYRIEQVFGSVWELRGFGVVVRCSQLGMGDVGIVEPGGGGAVGW